jgi:uncharacterized protein YacL
VVGVIGGVLGIMIGFLFWAINGLGNFIIVWSIVTICFVITMIILFYVGGKRRIREEKSLIEQNQAKMSKMQGKKMKEND